MPSSRSALGFLIRQPLRMLPHAMVVPVLSGSMKGMRWVIGSGPHGAWIGTLERMKLANFVHALRTGMTVWDIGANVGLYTLPSARAVGRTGSVYAFEPMPRNLVYLQRHVHMNGLHNVAIIPAAVHDSSGTLRMTEGDSPSEFHADAAGAFDVPAIALDTWVAETGSREPDVVKMDVEGAEAAVLRGGERTFLAHKPILYLSLHGDQQRQACGGLLSRWGYRVRSLEQGLSQATSSEWVAEYA